MTGMNDAPKRTPRFDILRLALGAIFFVALAYAVFKAMAYINS